MQQEDIDSTRFREREQASYCHNILGPVYALNTGSAMSTISHVPANQYVTHGIHGTTLRVELI
jgi:hypothetical protein